MPFCFNLRGDVEVAIVYYRAGYKPQDFVSQKVEGYKHCTAAHFVFSNWFLPVYVSLVIPI